MKKLLSLFVSIIMVLSLGCFCAFGATDYLDIRLAKSDTVNTQGSTATIIVEGFNGGTWEQIDPSLIKFSSQSRFVEINENGEAKLTDEFHTLYAGSTGEKSLSTPITATYTLSDRTTLTKKVLVMFGSAAVNKIIAADSSANTNTLTYEHAVDFADGLTGTKVTSSQATSQISNANPNVSNQDSFYEGWFYDVDGTSQSGTTGIIRFANDAVGAVNVFNLYLKTNGSSYALSDGFGTGEWYGINASGGKVVAPRSIGWHQFALDVCSGNRVRAYLDGELIYENTISFTSNPNMRKVVPGAGGNFYYDKFNILRSKVNTDVSPAVSYANVTGDVVNGNTLTADYDVIFSNSHTKVAPLFQWQAADDLESALEGNFTDLDGETSNTVVVTDDSKIYRYRITPKSSFNSEEKTGNTYNSSFAVKAYRPEAHEVKIEGINYLGATLTGSYDFYDINGDEEGSSIYEWYWDTDPNGLFTEPIPESSNTLTITSPYNTKYIKFAVTPVSQAYPYDGKKVYSEAIAPFIKPVATNVEITGEYGLGKTLTGTYTYESSSNAAEGSSILKWYRNNTVVKTSNKGDENADKYTVTSDDTDCNIYFEVTPVCENGGIIPQNECTGTPLKSESFLGAVKPAGSSAVIMGTLIPGNTVIVDYTYTHATNIPEGDTQYKIYVGGELKSNTKSLYITADMAGKTIYAVVYPKAAVEPSDGVSLQTASRMIGYSSSTPITVPPVSSGTGISGGTSTSSNTAESTALKTVKNAIVLKVNSNKTLVNGSEKNVDENTAVVPFIENSRTLLPLRYIAESLGANVMWTDETREIKITLGSNTIIMHLGSDIYTINGIEYKMDVEAKSVSGRTMIPVRYISEALNKSVFWDDKGLIVISDKNNIFDSTKDSAQIDALIAKLK